MVIIIEKNKSVYYQCEECRLIYKIKDGLINVKSGAKK